MPKATNNDFRNVFELILRDGSLDYILLPEIGMREVLCSAVRKFSIYVLILSITLTPKGDLSHCGIPILSLTSFPLIFSVKVL